MCVSLRPGARFACRFRFAVARQRGRFSFGRALCVWFSFRRRRAQGDIFFLGVCFASRFRFAVAGQRGRFSFWACALRVVFVSPSRGGGRDRPAQPGTRRAVGAETERLRRAERPAERGRLRRGCFGMAAAKAGAGSCDADASEWQQPQTDAGSCLRVLHIVANE